MNKTATPGAVLKSLRLSKGWTLTEVSQKTGLPVSTLSKVENDKMSMSYDKLARISRGLEIDIGLLFSSEAKTEPPKTTTGRRSITRAGEGRVIDTETYGHTYPATDLLNKRFVPIIAEIHAQSLSDFPEMIRHSGEEYAFVLEGTVELHSDLYAPVTLNVGDSIYFDSGMGHVYLRVGPAPCRVLSICSGDESQLIGAMAPEPKAEAPAVQPLRLAHPPKPATRKRVAR